MDPDREVADDVESNAPTLAQGTTTSESRPVIISQGGEAREAFFQRLNELLVEFFQTNLAAQHPPPPPNPQPALVAPQGAEEFRANVDDDPEREEFWLENSIRYLKCAISLLKDSAFHWWNTLVSVVPRERVTSDFFQEEFRKKYISKVFIDQKRKEFLELKQGRMTVTEYE
ncbi:Protein MCM10 [Gossypium australe]|uniref:Protein MCM10 n=1 Tax=Gossypium australe TaxID=47621 RepID=A0A5B6VMF5_9ROSI|nr:Protein MCM10 [Gossypium australe]